MSTHNINNFKCEAICEICFKVYKTFKSYKKHKKISHNYNITYKDSILRAYIQKPKLCKQCNSAIEYNKRNNVFCNSSCAGIYNGYRRILKSQPIQEKQQRLILSKCLLCNKNVSQRKNKFCSLKCSNDYKFKIICDKIESNNVIDISSKTMKRYLLYKFSHKCMICNHTEWNNIPITLELEHCNGNSSDNSLINCKLLCPNCHSQTSTYKSKNKGNGRSFRMKRYREGKSY